MADDNHPFVIKMPDEPEVSEFGMGYKLFNTMRAIPPERIAQYTIDPEESQTYGEFFDNCTRVAINLNAQNLSDDDIVCLCVGSSNKHSLVPYIASLFVGKITAALDPLVLAEDKAKMLQKVTPKIIFVEDKYLSDIEKTLKIAKLDIKLVVIGKNTNGHLSFDDFLVGSEEDVKSFEPVKVSSNDSTAIIFFSSGTSGIPKGICIPHLTLLTRIRSMNIPVIAIFAQLNWVSYAIFVFNSLMSGTARVLVDDFEINNVWKIINKYKVMTVFASIFQIAEFATHPIPKDLDISSLKILMTGGSILPPKILLKAKEVLPQTILVQGYGMTEMGGTVAVFNLRLPEHREWQIKKPDSCGTPIEGIWYKVVDPDTEEILGPNKPGELRLKSKYKMVGYHNMDSSDAYDSNGWFKTGDIVKYDEDHCFFVVDRIKEMIKYRCWIISPTAIENVLMTHPAVEKAAVVGIPNEEESDYPLGIVSLRDNLHVTPEELVKYVEERVMDRQRLRGGVKILKNIPLNSSGKIMKRLLRQMAMNGEI